MSDYYHFSNEKYFSLKIVFTIFATIYPSLCYSIENS